MFHVINQVEGVFEVWFQDEEFDYSWQHVADFDSPVEAEAEIACLRLRETTGV